jgi:hypothetical protein
MAEKTKSKWVILAPKHPPDSFTSSQLLKALKKVAEARRRKKQALVIDGSQ